MKRVMGMVMAAVLSAAILVGCGSASSAGNEIKTIQSRGVLRVGVKEDVPKFGYKDPATGKIDGFEVDVARAIANKLLGSPDKIELQAVNAKTRGPALDSDQLDVVVATFTVTDARKKSWNFSTPYYQDPVGLLVKNGGPASLKDLNGKTVGVAQGSTSKAAIQDAAAKAGITVNFSEFPSYAEVKA
ncbi:MAG: transporter substrate-binding domain-containing protein, partial [Mycobacterium leprae]